MALSNERVWIELSGLPPSRLRDYYARHDWNRLTRKDDLRHRLAGRPGIAANARAVARLMPRRGDRGARPGGQRDPRL
jgi:hypothetical protein